MTFGIQSIIANRTNLQSPCFLVSYAALKLFLKSIWRCTWTTSMMNPKSSLVNRIVVTLVTLIWLFIRSVTSKEWMHHRNYDKWISFKIHRSYIVIDFICKQTFLWFLKLPTKCIQSYIGGICNKTFLWVLKFSSKLYS